MQLPKIAVRLTDQTLSCTARALVTEARAARGAPACEARECAPRDAVLFLTFRGGSAAGPKPGRASFCGELGGLRRRSMEFTVHKCIYYLLTSRGIVDGRQELLAQNLLGL